MELNTHDDINGCLINCLDQWFKQGEVIPLDHPYAFRDVIWPQNQIGWDQLFVGKFTQEWLEVFNNLERSANKGCKKIDDYIWGVSLVQRVLTSVISCWEKRNAVVHSKNKNAFSPVWWL